MNAGGLVVELRIWCGTDYWWAVVSVEMGSAKQRQQVEVAELVTVLHGWTAVEEVCVTIYFMVVVHIWLTPPQDEQIAEVGLPITHHLT